jgi:hypothetical protein
MSEPIASTGKTKEGTCVRCGAEVELCEFVGLYEGKSSWKTPPHMSPCGLPCFGGGARGSEGLQAYRTGQMHGLKSPCPACGEPRG